MSSTRAGSDRGSQRAATLDTRLRRYYGLQIPYDFSVAVPLLLNVLCGTLLVLAAAALIYIGAVTIGSVRFYFLVYVALALLAGAALSRYRLVSLLLLTWSVAELMLAMFAAKARPPDVFGGDVMGGESRFVYHPLLQLVLKPRSETFFHFDPRNKSVFEQRGWYINWGVIGGKTIWYTHNSLGARGKEPTSSDLSKPMIAAYGGSTTHDVTVTQGETWVEKLQAHLDNRFTIVNFGAPEHTTAEHLSQTAFYGRVYGRWPACALYYIGWNDIHNAYVSDPDEAYADSTMLFEARRRPALAFARYSPLVSLLSKLLAARFDTVPKFSKAQSAAPLAESVRLLEPIFVDHVNTIKAINDSRGVRTIFIAQMLNTDIQTIDPNNRFPKNLTWWPLQVHFNSILKRAAEVNGAIYIDPGMDRFEADDFVDLGHFSANGSGKFAEIISSDVRAACDAERN